MKPTADFNPVTASRRILRQARTGALATLTASGAPFASLVTVATATDGSPLLLLSTLAVHTANLARDARASILLELRQPGDPLQGSRISVSGRMIRLDPEMDAVARRRFLARQPEAVGYAAFRDFALWRMEVEGTHLVAGFGRIVEIPATDLLLPDEAAVIFAAAEPDLLDRLNAEAPDLLPGLGEACLATSPAPASGSWRAIGIDPEGLDLGHETAEGLTLHRLPFLTMMKDVRELPADVKEIAVLTGMT
jgi:heme iron utilization protein